MHIRLGFDEHNLTVKTIPAFLSLLPQHPDTIGSPGDYRCLFRKLRENARAEDAGDHGEFPFEPARVTDLPETAVQNHIPVIGDDGSVFLNPFP